MTAGRAMPTAPEAEASLLGTMMVYPQAARIAIEEGLKEDDFYNNANRRIFIAANSLYQEGIPVDLTTLSTRLKDQNQLDHVGGIPYLMTLSESAVTSANTKNYVHLIHDKAVMRAMIEAADEISKEGMEGQTDINEYLDKAEKSILNISRDRRTSEFKNSTELMNSVMENIMAMNANKSDVTGLKTGYKDLDHVTHGFQPGDLIILAARPSMGKTAVALNLALHCALYDQSKSVAIFSLEMGAEQLAMRLLSAHSRVPGDHLKTGYLDQNEMNKIGESATDLKRLKLFIDDMPNVHVSEIFSKCRRLQAEHGLSLILIDYIQLIAGSGHSDSRQQEVSEISRGLKALARELKVPVIALSQLSRTVESREIKKPMLSDLRESGAIEQDADLVMLLYRDAYYNEEAKKKAEEVGSELLEINIAKHRNGATRRIEVAFEGNTNAIMNLERTNESAQ